MKFDGRQVAQGLVRRSRVAIAALRGEIGAVVEPSTVEAPADDEEGWWNLLPFTTHRIEVRPGIHTRVDDRATPLEDFRTELVVRRCDGSLAGRSVVDLGSLEGGFTLAFAERGAEHALGIEARAISVERAELARRLMQLDNAEFVVADVKDELAQRGAFDVVFATGLLYHVADPAAMLQAMRGACRHVVLIDTHVAGAAEATHGCSEPLERTSGGETYRGRIRPEYPSDSSPQEREEMLWAAYSDVDAFWPFEADLVRMIEHAGFGHVEKIEWDAAHDAPWEVDKINRVIYLATV